MFRKLVEEFQNITSLPVEIPEICQAIVRLGAQEKVFISPEEMDTGKLKGVFYQYIERSGVYSDPERVTIIVYPANVNLEEQRAICAKELVHLCDKQVRKVKEPEQVRDLVSKLLGPSRSNGIDFADAIAATDILAQFQAMSLLFPQAARLIARQKIASGERTLEDIYKLVCAPTKLIDMMLEPEWDAISETLIDF